MLDVFDIIMPAGWSPTVETFSLVLFYLWLCHGWENEWVSVCCWFGPCTLPTRLKDSTENTLSVINHNFKTSYSEAPKGRGFDSQYQQGLSVRSITSEPLFGGVSRSNRWCKEGKPIRKAYSYLICPNPLAPSFQSLKKEIPAKCEVHCGSSLHLEAITAVHF